MESRSYHRPMRKLDFYIILTADGMYADPDGGLDHYEPAEDEHRYANGLIRDAGEIVYGRAMYDVMRYWDTVDVDDPAVADVEREFAQVLGRDAETRRLARAARARAGGEPPRGRCRRGGPAPQGTGRVPTSASAAGRSCWPR